MLVEDHMQPQKDSCDAVCFGEKTREIDARFLLERTRDRTGIIAPHYFV